jgi:L-lactate dehydrogenase complex protein LldG
MAISPAKENILKKIRQALSNPVPLPFPNSEGSQSVFTPASDDHAIVFAEEFTNLQGKFAFCQDEKDLLLQLHLLFTAKAWTKFYAKETAMLSLLKQMQIEPWTDLESCDVSLTGCEYLVARTGSIVLSSAQQNGRTTSVYAPIHICIAYNSQLVYDVKDALQTVKEKYTGKLPSFLTFASGPSRTADIEKTLVTGVHGPKEVFCFLIDG